MSLYYPIKNKISPIFESVVPRASSLFFNRTIKLLPTSIPHKLLYYAISRELVGLKPSWTLSVPLLFGLPCFKNDFNSFHYTRYMCGCYPFIFSHSPISIDYIYTTNLNCISKSMTKKDQKIKLKIGSLLI